MPYADAVLEILLVVQQLCGRDPGGSVSQQLQRGGFVNLQGVGAAAQNSCAAVLCTFSTLSASRLPTAAGGPALFDRPDAADVLASPHVKASIAVLLAVVVYADTGSWEQGRTAQRSNSISARNQASAVMSWAQLAEYRESAAAQQQQQVAARLHRLIAALGCSGRCHLWF